MSNGFYENQFLSYENEYSSRSCCSFFRSQSGAIAYFSVLTSTSFSACYGLKTEKIKLTESSLFVQVAEQTNKIINKLFRKKNYRTSASYPKNKYNWCQYIIYGYVWFRNIRLLIKCL